MRQTFTLLFTAILSLSICTALAKSSNDWKVTYGNKREFIENKGQFQLRHPSLKDKDIRYGIDHFGSMVYFTPGGVTYHFYTMDKNLDRKKGDKSKPRNIAQHELIEVQWLGSNPNVEIVPLNKQITQHGYAFKADKNNPANGVDHLNAYGKLLYKNLYPNIDVEYEIHPESGIKYSIILRPGADVSKVKLQYADNKKLTKDEAGKLHIATAFGDIVEHQPLTFYKGNKDNVIASAYAVNNNTISFNLGKYNPNKTVVIDPWVQTPNFNTQWKCAWECDKDASGSAFIIGGVMPLQLQKYSAAGALLWTYNTPYDTSNTWLGALAVDDAGNAYVTEGTGGGIVKVNGAGTLVYNNTSAVGGISTEFWTITFNCDQTRLVIGGTGGALPPLPYIYQVNLTNGNVTNSLQVTGGALFPTQEVRAIAPAGNGKYYFLSHDSIGYINQNFSACSNPTTAKSYFPNSYSFGYKCENFRRDNTGICALRTYGGFAYVNRGDRLDKRDLSTLAIVQSVTIPGGGFASSQVQNSGIDIDDCGNIFVGSRNQVVKFNQALQQQATYATSFNVYDVSISTAGDIIATGSTGTSSGGARTGYVQQIAGGACGTVPIICCDATMCNVPALCQTAAPVTITVSTPGGTFSGPGVNPTTGVFNPATAGVGTHKIKYTLACGSDSINIVVSPCTSLSVCRENNGNLTVSNGVAPYTWAKDTVSQDCSACFPAAPPIIAACSTPPGCAVTVQSWKNFATGATVTPPGVYPLRVTDASGTTFVVSSANAVQPCAPCPAITVSVQTKQDATCASPNSGSATFTAAGGTGPYSYVWSPATGSTTATASNLAAGTYNVTATDANGCTGTGTVTIAAPASPTLSFSNQTNPTCGQNNGSVSVTLGGGTAPYVVTIDNGQGTPQTQNVPVAGTAPVNNLAAGTYTITVRDANNCTVSQTLTLTPPNSPTISTPVVAAETCAGQNNGSLTSATATGGTGTLQWGYATAAAPGNVTPIPAFPVNNLAPGNYILSVRDANNCTATINFTIAAGPNCCSISLAITTTTPTCGQSNGSITVTPSPSGNYTYTWSNALPAQATQNSLPAGQYRVTVAETGNPSCNEDTIINLNNTNGPTLTFSNKVDPNCGTANGSVSVTLAGGQAPYTVVVDNGLGTPQTQVIPIAGTAPLTGLAAGTYTISVTDALSCSAIQTITFTEPSPPVIISINATAESCFGDNDGTVSVTAIGGSGALVYNWSNGGSTPTLSGLSPNSYAVTITDALNCSATGNVTVSAGPVCCTWNITAAVTQPNCGASDGGINLTVLPSSTYAYAWSNGATTANNTNLGAGNFSVTITNTANNCVKDTSFNLSNSNGPTIDSFKIQNVSCGGVDDGAVTVYASSPNGVNVSTGFTWANTSTDTDDTQSDLTPGTYFFTVTDNSGCQATGSVVIGQESCCPLQISAAAIQPGCQQTTGTINITVTAQGTPPYEYSIDGSSYQSGAAFANLSPGNYTVYARDFSGCGDTTTVVINTVTNNLALTLSPTSPGCAGNTTGSIAANVSGANGNVNYLWSSNATTSSISGLQPGAYSVTITDAGGCTATASTTITQAQPISVNIGDDVTFCQGQNATLTAPAGFVSYLWSDGATTASTTATTSGTYSVTVTDANGCSATDALVAIVVPTPVIDLLTDTTVYENNAVILRPVINGSTQGAKYLWEPETGLSCNDCAIPVATPDDTITYLLVYTDANSCTATATVKINVLTGGLIYMPNVFSPNGDNNNDLLLPLGVGIKAIEWKVFNRWGELVFLSTDKNIGWDGTFKGIAQPAGVYVYTMQVTFFNKTVQTYKGSVTLIR